MNHNMQAKQLKLQNQKNVVYHKIRIATVLGSLLRTSHFTLNTRRGSGQVLANGGVRPLWWEHNILDHSQN